MHCKSCSRLLSFDELIDHPKQVDEIGHTCKDCRSLLKKKDTELANANELLYIAIGALNRIAYSKGVTTTARCYAEAAAAILEIKTKQRKYLGTNQTNKPASN